MKIQTFSIVAGSKACNARCPFCVARMTGLELDNKEPLVNWRNFRKACILAKMKEVTTVLITGKGEPTLFPDQITKYLTKLQEFEFPFIELQTNGRMIAKDEYRQHLDQWYHLGLSTIAISVVHYEKERNQEIYQFAGGYYDLPALIKKLHDFRGKYGGFSVRLTLMMLEGYIDNGLCDPYEGGSRLVDVIGFCKDNEIEQLTIRTINQPEDTKDEEASDFVNKKTLHSDRGIRKYLETNGTRLRTLPHGATVYDVEGQNVCLANCLTIDSESDDIRQLIFFPDGHLRHDWQYKGAVLL